MLHASSHVCSNRIPHLFVMGAVLGCHEELIHQKAEGVDVEAVDLAGECVEFDFGVAAGPGVGEAVVFGGEVEGGARSV